ncbi:MAG: T9SS type A sorting domain-containing protein [Chitinophagales bacterium]|nr:T9SS type A sorting domain-containing protein [Chitinophagales bacterium]
MKKFALALFIGLLSITLGTNAQVITAIDSVQYINSTDLSIGNDLSYHNGDTLWIQGVCTFQPCLYAQSGSTGYPQRVASFLQNPGSTGFGGIQVFIDPAAIGMTNASDSVHALDNYTNFVNNFQPGTLVKCKGIVSNFGGNTQFLLVKTPSVALGAAAMPSPIVITVDSLSKLNSQTASQSIQYLSGEKYEGMYVQINNPIVTNVSTTTANRYRWSITDGAGNVISIQDNLSGNFTNTAYDQFCTTGGVSYTPNTYTGYPNGTALSYVRGIIVQNTNTTTGEKYYSLAPVLLSDVGGPTFAPPVISNVHINPFCPTSTQSVNVYADVTDDSSVVSVKVHYAFGLSNNTFTAVNASLSAGSTYVGVIPATTTDSTWVKYFIEAIDNGGHSKFYPDAVATNSYYLAIDKGINSIAAIQGRTFTNGSSIYANDSLTNLSIEGVVTSSSQTDDLGLVAIQDGNNLFSGIFIAGGNVSNLHRGERIRISSAKVTESFYVTTLNNPSFTILSSGNTLPTPITNFPIDSFNANRHTIAEPYEAMLLGVTNVAVIDTNPDFSAGKNYGEFSVHPTSSVAKGLRCDDQSNDIWFGFNTDSVAIGQNLCFVNGICTYSFGNWKLLPRNLSDICGFTTTYSKQITNFSINSIPAFINQSAKTIAITLASGTNVTALSPAVNFLGQTLSPNSGVATDFTNPVNYVVTAADNTTVTYVVTVTVLSGIEEIGLNAVSLFPNPASNQMNIQLNATQNNTLQLEVLNGVGQVVYTNKARVSNGNNNYSLNVSEWNNGVYFLQISAPNGMKSTHRFSVAH